MEFADIMQAEQSEMDITQTEVSSNQENHQTDEQTEEEMHAEPAAADGNDPNKVTYGEIEEMREAFSLFDQNRSGTIETSELGNIMRTLGYNPTEEEVHAFLQAADLSGDNVIDFTEFVTMIRNNKNKMNDDQLLKAFKVFDKDNNGLIDRNELRRILIDLNSSDATTEAQVDAMIRDADFNKDGYIDYKELVVYWKCK